jgi:hypothetical protein
MINLAPFLMSRPSKSSLVWGLAYHEAGHAVAAHHFGFDIDEVWIDEAMEDGKTTFSGSPSLKQRGLIALAGGIAQGRFDEATVHPGEGTRPPALLGDMIELRNVLIAAAPNDEAEQHRLRKEWQQEAVATLEQPEIWLAVTAVASRLETKRRLSGAEFRSIIPGSADREP